jgi:hypothetical protein
MRRLLTLLPFLAAPVMAQDVTNLADIINAILHPPAVVATVTSSGGTTCTIAKQASPTIYAVFNCTNSIGTLKSQALKIPTAAGTTGTYFGFPWGGFDITCVIAVNLTAVPTPAQGSYPIIASNGIAWQCSQLGATSAQIVAGAVAWP